MLPGNQPDSENSSSRPTNGLRNEQREEQPELPEVPTPRNPIVARMQIYLSALIHHLENGNATEPQYASVANRTGEMLKNLSELLLGEDQTIPISNAISLLSSSHGDLPVVLSYAYALRECLDEKNTELAPPVTDDEIALVFLEYLEDRDINSDIFLVTQQGNEISVVKGSQHRSPEEISRQIVDLPPGITMEVIGGKILKFTDELGGEFHERSSGGLAAWSDLLFSTKDIRPHSHCFVISHPFEVNGEWHLNRYLERYPYMPEHDRRSSHSSGVADSLQQFLDTELRMRIEEKDFSRNETTLELRGGEVKVLGPNRYGEVLLVDTLPGMEHYMPEPFRIYYNPETDVLRAVDGFFREYTVISGSLRAGEVLIEIPIQQGGEEQILRQVIRPRVGNRFPLQSVEIETISCD